MSSPAEIAKNLGFTERSALRGLESREAVSASVTATLQHWRLWDGNQHSTDLGRAVVKELEPMTTTSRFWIDIRPEENPFKWSIAVVDEDAGGVIAYFPDEDLAQIFVKAMLAQTE